MKSSIFILFFLYTRDCDAVDVQYQDKIVSGVRNDWFGRSVGSNEKIVVVGAPLDDNYAGSISIYNIQANATDAKVKIKSPGGTKFGFNVAVSKDFIVATAQGPTYLYIYSTEAPYRRITYWQIAYWYEPYGLSISEGNTIAVATNTYSDHSALVYVYNYVSGSKWKTSRYMWYKGGADLGELPSVTVSNNTLAAGIPGPDDWSRGIYVYTESATVWKNTDILRAHQDVWHFGGSIMAQGNTMVASARAHNGSMDLVNVYKRDAATGKWLTEGNPILPPGAPSRGSMLPAAVALENNMVFVTISDKESFPDVVAVVYKKVTVANNVVWKEHIALKTNGQPLLINQYNAAISCHGNKVFVTRTDRHGLGALYMFDLSRINLGPRVYGTDRSH